MGRTDPTPFLSRFPELGTGTIPVEPYLSREYYGKEIASIFLEDWLCVGREEEISKPGDYKVKRLDFAHTSVILIRGKDNKVRAFHNVCRHRGNKVITETGGEETFGSSRAAVVSCRFHGWVYNAEGHLVDETAIDARNREHAAFAHGTHGLAQRVRPIRFELQPLLHVVINGAVRLHTHGVDGGIGPAAGRQLP